ncbi:MAG: single-stranded DNA-binding protein [Specibacter sp.]
MANTVTIRGFATTGIELRTTANGLVVGDFRMGSNERRPDPVTNVWTEGPTNWFRVNVFRSLAQNAASSIHKGDRIIVVGKLKISTYLRKDGTTGTNVDIEADSIGPDLKYGMAHYTRMASAHPAGQDYARNDADPSAAVPFNSGGGDDGGHPEDRLLHRDAGQGMPLDGEEQEMDPEEAEDPTDPENDQESVGEGETLDKATGELVAEKAPF